MKKYRRFLSIATILVVITVAIMGVGAVSAQTAPIKIMSVGDSATAGVGDPNMGGYRTNLYTSYTNAGISFDFVGSQTGGPSSLPDRNHEGHSGWTIPQVASNVNNWLDTYNPDVMLLWIGGNDILQTGAPNTNGLSSLIDQITNRKPNLKLFVADYYHLKTNHPSYSQVEAYNAAIPGVVQAKANAGKMVYLVKLSDANLVNADYSTDNLHLTPSGYSKMATIWHSGTISILQSGGSATNTPTRTLGASPTRTPTPIVGASNTPAGPVPTLTRTPTPGTGGGTCSPVTSTITAPFTFDGAGTFCWQSSNLGNYINSWNTTSVTVNGVNFTNIWVSSGSLPAKINGNWYVSYSSSVAWGHFEAK